MQVAVQAYGDKGNGLVATSSVTANEQIISVPLAAMMTTEKAHASPSLAHYLATKDPVSAYRVYIKEKQGYPDAERDAECDPRHLSHDGAV